ncbi:MAG: hypothetical protein MRJ92_04140 [Nitrospira sp.]|nr:hypothetical protein [Nitrospira sp.]
MLVVGESASAESEIYGYVGANGLFELTNVPTEERFRSTDSHARRLTHRVSVEEVEEAVERYAWQFRAPSGPAPGCDQGRVGLQPDGHFESGGGGADAIDPRNGDSARCAQLIRHR